MGPGSGIRTFDKIDIILLPIVLLLRVSLIFQRLICFLAKVSNHLYGYLFHQGSPLGIHLEILPTLTYIVYILMHLSIFALGELQGFVQIILSFPVLLWRGVCFWPRLYFGLFGPGAAGRSIFAIIFDPEDETSTRRKIKNQKPAGTIRPLWSKFLVFSTYQVHGAYAHLFQTNNRDVSEPITEASGPATPRAWDPLRLAVPYKFLATRIFQPPDCHLRRGLTIALLIAVYLVPGSPIEGDILSHLPERSAKPRFFSTPPRRLTATSTTTCTSCACNIRSHLARERLSLFRDGRNSLHRGQLRHMHHHQRSVSFPRSFGSGAGTSRHYRVESESSAVSRYNPPRTRRRREC